MGFAVNSIQRQWLDNTFDTVYNPYFAAYLVWEDEAERTKSKTIAFNEAEAAFKPVFRELYKGFLKSSPVNGCGFERNGLADT
jgi:mitochondrial fission protein ELM1